jgi:MATE family multidrug resistance protein
MTDAVNPGKRTLSWPAEMRATMRLATPLVLTNVSQMALGTTDVVLMGWLGPHALAAGALGTNLNFAFLIFAIGLMTATSPMIAIEIGRKHHSVRDVRRTIRQGIWAAVCVAIPLWIVLWNGEAIFLLLGQDPEIAAEAALYLRALQWSILPFLVYVVLRNFISALERPFYALAVATAAVLVNAVLVWALIFGRLGLPELGLVGAGIGTTITNILMAVGLAILISVDRRFRRYHLFGRFWRPDWQRFRELWWIGLPIAVTLVFEVTIFNAATFLMGIIGTEQLAAHAIAIQVASLVFMVPLGIGMAATVRVGLAQGRGDPVGIARAGWSAFIISLIFACAAAVLLLVAREPIVGIFLDLRTQAHQTVIGLAIVYLGYAALFQLVDAAQAAAIGVLRGLGDTRVPMIMAAIGYWGVGVPVGVALAFWGGMEGSGIWIGLAVGLAVVAVMMTARWMRRERHGLVAHRSAKGPAAPAPA